MHNGKNWTVNTTLYKIQVTPWGVEEAQDTIKETHPFAGGVAALLAQGRFLRAACIPGAFEDFNHGFPFG